MSVCVYVCIGWSHSVCVSFRGSIISRKSWKPFSLSCFGCIPVLSALVFVVYVCAYESMYVLYVYVGVL